MLFLCTPALAQNPPELRLCPPPVAGTCFIGCVASAGKILVLFSSMTTTPWWAKKSRSTRPGQARRPAHLGQIDALLAGIWSNLPCPQALA
jgi:hypothetical protein